jgi:hypothetical protein
VLKVKVRGAFTTISLSAEILKNSCPQYIDFDIFTFEAYYNVLIIIFIIKHTQAKLHEWGVSKSCNGSFSFEIRSSKVKIILIFATKTCRKHNLAMHWLRFGWEIALEDHC